MKINDAGKNNIVESDGHNFENFVINFNGENNRVTLKTNNIRNSEIHISGDNHEIVICENARIDNVKVNIQSSDSIPTRNSRLVINENTFVQSSHIFLQGDKTQVSIGKGTTILGCLFFTVEYNSTITVGEDCMLSWGIEIRTSDWHSIYDLESGERINNQKPVNIEDRVWIGSHAFILKGVTIASDSVIGTHAIVTKSVPPNCVVAGNPAKIIKRNVKWGREDNMHEPIF